MRKTTRTRSLSGLFIVGSLYPYSTGGMEIFNYYFLRKQVEREDSTIYYLGENQINGLAENLQKGGRFVHFRKLKPTRIFYPIQFIYVVFKLRNKIDYAYISYAEQSWIISFSQSLTLRLFRIPYIITIHWGKDPEWRFKFPFLYYFKHAHAVAGVSEPICKSFKNVIPEQEFQFIPPLIPFQLSSKTKSELKNQFKLNPNAKILLFVGSLKPMKNPDIIITAFKIIGPAFLEDNKIQLLIVGKGEMENELNKLISDLDLNKYIRLTGLVSRENIPDYYKLADCYIISSDYEGTSVSLLEAMVNNKVIIASDAPGVNGMLKHEYNALLYSTKDPFQLAESIVRVFSDHILSEKLAENALTDFHAKYSFDSMILQYQRLFSSVKQ